MICDMRMSQDLFDAPTLETTLLSLQAPLVGVDEVGRGCLAGPVVAAAVSFRLGSPVPEGLTDSKLLSEKQRDKLFPLIVEHHHYGIGIASVEEVDEINILQASFVAMKRALVEMRGRGCVPGFVLVDGHMEIPGLDCAQAPVVKGDLRVSMIAAASIIAKVSRDRMMRDYDMEHPGYGFAKHKGYASEVHRTAIREKGPCLIHRRSFSGVKEYLEIRA